MATQAEIDRKIEKKYRKVFDRMFRRIVRQSPQSGTWELVNVGPHNPILSWRGFRSGNWEIGAMRPVTIRGRQCWAVAGTETDGNAMLNGLMIGGLLGFALGATPKPHLSIWTVDPRAGYEPDANVWMRTRHYVKSYDDVKAIKF